VEQLSAQLDAAATQYGEVLSGPLRDHPCVSLAARNLGLLLLLWLRALSFLPPETAACRAPSTAACKHYLTWYRESLTDPQRSPPTHGDAACTVLVQLRGCVALSYAQRVEADALLVLATGAAAELNPRQSAVDSEANTPRPSPGGSVDAECSDALIRVVPSSDVA